MQGNVLSEAPWYNLSSQSPMPNPRQPPLGVYNPFNGTFNPASATAREVDDNAAESTADSTAADSVAADSAAAGSAADIAAAGSAADSAAADSSVADSAGRSSAVEALHKSDGSSDAAARTTSVSSEPQALEASLCTDLAFRLGSCLAIRGECCCCSVCATVPCMVWLS